MDDMRFQDWMRRMAATDESADYPSARAIQWRARLRRRLDAEERVTRPIRIAEDVAAILCWLLAAVISADMGLGELVAVLATSVAIVGGLRAIGLKRI
jgi:hypothetical protein